VPCPLIEERQRICTDKFLHKKVVSVNMSCVHYKDIYEILEILLDNEVKSFKIKNVGCSTS